MRTIAGALLLLIGTAQAQEKTPADKSIREYLTARALELEKGFFPEVKTAADFEKLRPPLREQYFDMLGLRPLPEKTPLHPTVTGTLTFPGFTVEKLHYQSRPGLYVTANVYAPSPNEGRHPAILYSVGHYNGKRDGHKVAVQDHGIWFATHGYVCIILDTIELGEVTTTHHGTYNKERWWWHSAGFTPAGSECWNAIRGIDYLQSRPDVDPERIGATGISGGGAATFWISAADERIKASAPVSGMADLTWYIGEDGVNGHCDCMFLYNVYRWNWTTIAGLICPRPLLFVNSDADPIFPMSANERVINRLERLYSKFGVSDKVDAMVSVGGHAYRTDLRRAIFEFFNRELKRDATPVTDADSGLGADGKASRIPPADLRVFKEDKDVPADCLNTKIDESFNAIAQVELPKAGDFEAWRKARLDRLRETCFRAWPAPGSPAGEAELKAGAAQRCDPPDADASAWRIVLNPDEPLNARPAWADPIVSRESACLVQTRGSGPSAWTRKNPPNTIERSMALLGTTADAGRVWDVVAVGRGRRALGRGQAGILAAYAALLDPSIESVTIVDPPISHRTGPHFLGVLKVCDIPEALGMLAPRPLTLINAKDPAFDRTAELYRLAGAADKLTRK